MLNKLWQTLRPVVFWSYRRGSWQYDIIVVLILVFIFLTPREFFGDQPRPRAARQIEEIGDGQGTMVYWVKAEIFDETPAEELDARLRGLLKQRSGLELTVVETKPAPGPGNAVHGYLVYARQ